MQIAGTRVQSLLACYGRKLAAGRRPGESRGDQPAAEPALSPEETREAARDKISRQLWRTVSGVVAGRLAARETGAIPRGREKEEAMLDTIGEATAQQLPRIGVYGGGREQEPLLQKAERLRETRPVEGGGEGEKPRAGGEEGMVHNRTRLENGTIVVEKYDEDGKLIRRTPPGYLPFGEIA